jgi:hypothetical protein
MTKTLPRLSGCRCQSRDRQIGRGETPYGASERVRNARRARTKHRGHMPWHQGDGRQCMARSRSSDTNSAIAAVAQQAGSGRAIVGRGCRRSRPGSRVARPAVRAVCRRHGRQSGVTGPILRSVAAEDPPPGTRPFDFRHPVAGHRELGVLLRGSVCEHAPTSGPRRR